MTKRDPRANGGNDTDRFETSMLEGILATLQNSERRQILYFLQDQPVATVEELARHLAALETGISADEVSQTKRTSYGIRLKQNHLPRMAAASLLDYDERSDTVHYTDPSTLLDLFLQLTAQVDRDRT